MDRLKIVMECFDKLPEDLRDWLNYHEKRFVSDVILRGEAAVRRLKTHVELGGKLKFIGGKNEN